MKTTKCFIFGMALVYTLLNLAISGCTQKGGAQNLQGVNDTLVLDIRKNTADVNWTDTCEGGYWDHTYDDEINSIRFGEFIFSHLPAGPGAAFGPNGCPGMYWDGFTVSSNGDSMPHGNCCPDGNCDSTYSEGWVAHQWGVMAGGGIDTIINGTPSVVKGVPYLLAYWGYHMEEEWWYLHYGDIPPEPMHCLTVALADSSLFKPQEVWICNSPWPYYGNICGDGFAHPLDTAGAHFFLKIASIDKYGDEQTVTDTLAYYDTSLWQPADWHRVDLTRLGEDIREIYFTMETTDTVGGYGPNTAVYFCLDKLKVVKLEGTASSGTLAQKAKVRTVEPGAKGALEVTDHFPIVSHTGGEVLVYDANGKEVLKTTVKAGEKPNLSKLPKGEYRLRHGHKHIPFKKVK
jgi:hypothetical protein